MAKVKKYQKIILDILKDYEKVRYSNINAENRLIADKENHRYQVVTIGWDGRKFVHDCPMHFDIIDGKIWVQRNMTEVDLERIFRENGVPNSDIVIGFLSPKMREYGDYAVAWPPLLPPQYFSKKLNRKEATEINRQPPIRF